MNIICVMLMFVLFFVACGDEKSYNAVNSFDSDNTCENNDINSSGGFFN